MKENSHHKMFGVSQRPGETPALLSQHLRAVLDLAGALDGAGGASSPQRCGRRALLLGRERRRRGRAGRRGPAEPGAAPNSLAGRHCGARSVRLQATAAPTLLRRLACATFFVHFASPGLYSVTLWTQSQYVTLCLSCDNLCVFIL